MLGFGLVLAGCVGDELDGPGELEDDLAVNPSAAELELDAAQEAPIPTTGSALGENMIACPGARIIGVLSHADLSCNIQGIPSGWTATKVFEHGTPSLTALGLPAAGELGRYCLFERQPTPQTASDYDAMLNAIAGSGVIDIDSVAADCHGQAPQASLNDPDVSVAMRDLFREAIDWVAPAMPASHDVRVGLIDTVSGSGSPNNAHGLQLAAIIDDIACPSGFGCRAQIEQQLALPREDWATPPDWIAGGSHGTKVDVALAIYEQVAVWRRDLAYGVFGTPERLILNVSLGYNRGSALALQGDRGPDLALRSALEFAACSGALVFAAAGNDRDPGCDEGSDDDGALLPAALQSQDAPTSLECHAAGYPHTAWNPSLPVFPSSSRPLIYAVGGVDAFDEPLINSRANGQPRLVAAGSNGLAEVGSGGSWFDALTGTSVATAVASGTAALIWTYDPTLRPDEVADLLYTSGWATGANADFGSPASTAVRRISVCAALEQAMPGLGSGCVAGPAAANANIATYTSEVDDVLALASVYACPTEPSGASPSCSPPDYSDLAEPQPEVPVCPHCNIDSPPEEESSSPDEMLIMEVDSSWAGRLSSGYLTSYDDSRSATRFVLDSDVILHLNSGYVATVVLDAPGTVNATLSFEVVDRYGRVRTQTNSITVTHGD